MLCTSNKNEESKIHLQEQGFCNDRTCKNNSVIRMKSKFNTTWDKLMHSTVPPELGQVETQLTPVNTYEMEIDREHT